MVQRVGVFGGTFDPPHLGHLILASEANSQLDLDRMLWVLTAIPPHKLGRTISPLEDRLAMLQLALQDEPAFQLSTVDMDRPGPHYTSDTVKLLTDFYPGADLVLILGGDSLHDLPSWHNPMELIASCSEIGVMRRPVDSIDLAALEEKLPGVTPKVKLVDAPLLEIASHEIRERAREGRPFRYFVLPSVYEYILRHNLYQAL
jgi:nicotinate-nucleotide adenylyltransferase